MVDEGINQGQLAKELGISPAILSNYMTGKNIPEMETIEKCIKRFNLEGGKIKEIFTQAFFSTAQANHSIHLDTRFFNPERLDLLAEAIVVLMLYPDDPGKKQEPFDPRLELLRSRISGCFKSLDIEAEYQSVCLDRKDNQGESLIAHKMTQKTLNFSSPRFTSIRLNMLKK
ncbi:MAG: helix-turn-helix domain-containing protein [Treponema sp.]|jgi:transcriptional regulator with XRE-family HTH domain|nr:helix-turn-helix domain-containing protein [Treponema sp.]